jgi:hypothetical protein
MARELRVKSRTPGRQADSLGRPELTGEGQVGGSLQRLQEA